MSAEISTAFRAGVIAALRDAVGEAQVLSTPDLTEQYCIDWTRRFGGPALAVVRPGSTDEVSAVLRICSELGVPVLPQGGNTGLVGGSVPAASGSRGQAPVIVSTRRLSTISPVDELSGQLTAGAGATLGDVQRAARKAGWEYGVDFASRESATIGGTVATNAGGIRVLAYGMTRMQLRGIEAVLADGSVISHLSGLEKDNTGFDLAQLLCGSEGTLAVVTAVRLKLHPPMGQTSVALIGCSDYDDALGLLRTSVDASAGSLVAAEVMDATGIGLVCDVAGLPYPLSEPHALIALLEVADGGGGEGFIASAFEGRDVVVGLEAREIARLWQYRERQAEAFASLGVIHKLDISVPLRQLAACINELRSVVARFSTVTECGIFGHLADGNMHVQVAGPAEDDSSTDRAIVETVAKFGGSISAEHGIGREKAAVLGLSRSKSEIEAMRAIKRAWDPQGLMNPGVLFV